MNTAPPLAPVVTIDGPSGAGKGTVSRVLADRLGWHLLDSGALYRLVALAGQRQGIDPQDRGTHARLARTLDARFGQASGGGEAIWLDSTEISTQLRTEECGMGASRVAAWPEVREALLDRQRAYARPPGLVADGRDMGTVVFPSAPLKLFLSASAEARAERRHKQLKEKGSDVSLAALSREIAARDRQDSSRPVAPLVPAGDAIVIDSTALTAAEVVDAVWLHGVQRGLWPSRS